jgi:hypothetical protein
MYSVSGQLLLHQVLPKCMVRDQASAQKGFSSPATSMRLVISEIPCFMISPTTCPQIERIEVC